MLLKNAWQGVHFDAAPNPKFDAQVLLCAVLGCSSAQLFAHGNDPLTPEKEQLFHSYIERRAKHEPVALIIGKKAFYGRDFLVNASTLIPRPETELIIETSIPLVEEGTVVIDVGTGGGAIAITMARETEAPVVAIDISEDALIVAQINAQTHQVAHRIAFWSGNLLLPFFKAFTSWPDKEEAKHLLLIANLPYLSKNQWEALDPDVKNFEPKTALVGGRSGLELYDELLMQLKSVRPTLPSHITLLFEIDPSQKESAPKLIRAHFPDATIEVKNDLAALPRMILAKL